MKTKIPKIPLPKNTIDETGNRYGYLRVIEYAGSDGAGTHASWLCRCQCGKRCKGSAVVRGSRLRAGRQISCGMLRADPGVRHDARMKTPARRRKQIAKLGAQARERLNAPTPKGRL
jgi:hypothetical protein